MCPLLEILQLRASILWHAQWKGEHTRLPQFLFTD
jgi:hypothetical protein